MKMTKEQREALEEVAEQAVAIYTKVIESTGSVEMAKDILGEYFKAMIHGNRKSGWMM